MVLLALLSVLALRVALDATAGDRTRRRAAALHGAATVAARPTWLDRALEEATVPIDAPLARRAWAGGAALCVTGATIAGGIPLAVLSILAVTVGPVAALHALRGRRDRLVEQRLPDALDAIARSLRSGASLRQAVVEAARDVRGALGDDLQRVVRQLEDGRPLGEALDAWAGERPSSALRLATAALSLGAETGGASAQAVDGVAATLRTNLAIAGEVRALSSQARLSALVIALAPVGFTLFAASTDPRVVEFLLRTPGGLACLVTGLSLDLVGALWMRRLAAVVA